MKKIMVPLVLVAMISCGVYLGVGIINKAKAQDVTNTEYAQKSVYDEMDDGWIYTFEILYPNDDSERVYMFDGYNLKYKQLDGYYVPVVDSTTNKEIDRVIPEYITLSISEHSKKDIEEIVKYFNEKQFDNKITIKDLSSLNISTISKEYLVDIFNRTIDSKLKTEPGEYYKSNFIGRVSVESSDSSMPGEWQATYILNYGDVYNVDIEFIDQNGKYLDAKQKENTLSEKESELVSEIETLENRHVIDNMTSNYRANSLNGIDNPDLNKLMVKLQEKLTSED